MAHIIKEVIYRGKCTEKENIFGPRRVIGTRVITLTITEKVMELIISHKINLIAVFGREEYIKQTSFDPYILTFLKIDELFITKNESLIDKSINHGKKDLSEATVDKLLFVIVRSISCSSPLKSRISSLCATSSKENLSVSLTRRQLMISSFILGEHLAVILGVSSTFFFSSSSDLH